MIEKILQYDKRPQPYEKSTSAFWEFKDWSSEERGFWRDEPYICLHAFYRYDDATTFLDRYIVATDDTLDCYNVWERVFTADELRRDLRNAGFKGDVEFYGDVSGAPVTPESETLCLVAMRPKNA